MYLGTLTNSILDIDVIHAGVSTADIHHTAEVQSAGDRGGYVKGDGHCVIFIYHDTGEDGRWLDVPLAVDEKGKCTHDHGKGEESITLQYIYIRSAGLQIRR